MIRIVLFFAVIFAAFYFGIPVFRELKGKEKLEVIGLVAYSAFCAVLTIIVMALFVITF